MEHKHQAFFPQEHRLLKQIDSLKKFEWQFLLFSDHYKSTGGLAISTSRKW